MTTTTLTVSVDAAADALQSVTRDMFPRALYAEHVTDGAWASVDLPPADAHRLADELRTRGYRVTVR